MTAPRPSRWAAWRATARRQRDTLLLAAAALLLAAALFFQPSLPLQRKLFVHLVVLDVTQSMNVQDQLLAGKPVSRGAFAKEALRQSLLQLPCGSRVGLGLFTEYRSYLLLAPVEVCSNLQELRATLAQMDNRMAWTGNSEVTKGLYSGIGVAKQLGGKTLADTPSLVFITDGQEAPPLDPARKPPFNGQAGEVKGVIVGVGGLVPQAIPKTDPLGRSLGFWAADEVLHADPRTARQNALAAGAEAAASKPKPGKGSEHLSSLREAHLRLLASETGLSFLRLHETQAPQDLADALTAPGLARPVPARMDLRGFLAAAAAALLVLLLVVRQWPAWVALWRRLGLRFGPTQRPARAVQDPR